MFITAFLHALNIYSCFTSILFVRTRLQNILVYSFFSFTRWQKTYVAGLSWLTACRLAVCTAPYRKRWLHCKKKVFQQHFAVKSLSKHCFLTLHSAWFKPVYIFLKTYIYRNTKSCSKQKHNVLKLKIHLIFNISIKLQ